MTDFGSKSLVVSTIRLDRGCAFSITCVRTETSPVRPVVDLVFVDDESAVGTDSLVFLSSNWAPRIRGSRRVGWARQPSLGRAIRAYSLRTLVVEASRFHELPKKGACGLLM
jgi:hypothetical protein